MIGGGKDSYGTGEDEKACGDASAFAKATADREAATREGCGLRIRGRHNWLV